MGTCNANKELSKVGWGIRNNAGDDKAADTPNGAPTSADATIVVI